MLKQKFSVDFGSKLSIYLLTAITGIIVSRMAGPEVIGTIAYATSYVSIFLFITGLFGTAYVKLVSEGENESNCYATYRLLWGITQLVFVIVVMTAFFSDKQLPRDDTEYANLNTIILIMLAATVINNIYQFNQTVFNAKTEQAKSNIPNLWKAFAYNSLRIIVVILGFGALGLVCANLVSAILLLPIIITLLRKKKVGHFDKNLAKKFISISTPLLITVITGSLIMYLDKILLKNFTNTLEVGYYAAAYSIGGMLIMLGNSAGTVFFPLFSSLIIKNDFKAIRSRISNFERFIFSFILPLIVTLSIFSYPILVSLLGTKYEASAPIFSLLVISSFLIIWGIPYANIITGLGKFWLYSIISIFKFVLFLLVLVFLIHPKLQNTGGMGLAYTQVLINLASLFAYYYFAWKNVKISFIRIQLKFVSFWLILFLLSKFILIPLLIDMNIYLQTFIIVPVFVITSIFLQYTLGLSKKNDFVQLIQLINPKNNLRYVREEFNDLSHHDSSSSI